MDRFWDKVKKTEGCWEWTGKFSTTGYGVLPFNAPEKGKRPCGRSRRKYVKAHRISWELHFGAIKSGLLVCHACDNRKCVNPAHLFLGTIADNNVDMTKKGRRRIPPPRSTPGESHPLSKLTESQVEEIRSRYAAGGILQKELAQDYGVHKGTISKITLRTRWQ